MLRYSRLYLLWLAMASCASAADDSHNKKFINNKPSVAAETASLRRRLIDATEAKGAATIAPAEGETIHTGESVGEVVADNTQTQSEVTPQEAAGKSDTTALTETPDGGGSTVAVATEDATTAFQTTPDTTTQPPPDSQTGSGETEIIVTPPENEGDPQTPNAATGGGGGGDEIPNGTNNPPADQKQQDGGGTANAENNACILATDCEACKLAAMLTQSTNQDMTCLWNVKEAAPPCTLVQQADAPAPADVCLKQNEAVAPTPPGSSTDNSKSKWDEGDNNDEGDDGGSSFTLVVGCLAVVLVGGAALRFRKQAASRFGGGDDGKSIAVSDFGSILGSAASRSTYNKSETVPLSRATADDDEEWGWEDSSAGSNNGGAVEMTAKKDDEDLTMAFAMSQTRPSAPKSSPMSRPKSASRPSAPSSYSHNSHTTTAAAAAATPAMPAMHITSLGVKKATGASSLANKKKPIKKKDDDLFASMGLAAKPTFSHVPKPKAPAKTKSSALAATDLGGDADWDDDGDLDDLLND